MPTVEVQDAIDRRQFVLGGAALIGLLVGCGDDDEGATPSADRVITDDRGEVTVAGAPSRIVSTSEEVTELLASLGIEPIGFASGRIDAGASEIPADHYLHDALASSTFVGGNDPLNYEAVAALSPDLIVHYQTGDEIASLEAIAPTLVYDVTAPDAWQQALGRLGAGLDRSLAAESAADGYRTDLMAAAESLADVVAAAPRISVLILDYRGGGENIVLGPEFALAAVFAELGFEVTGEADGEAMSPGVASISTELVGSIDTDTFLVLDMGPVDETVSARLVEASGHPVVHVSIGLDRPSTGPLTARYMLQGYTDALLAQYG